MYIKPKPEPKKPKQPKQEKPQTSPEHPGFVRIKRMAQIGLDQLSREYVIEHKKLVILSWDYVIEHGKEFGYDGLWWDPCDGYFIYDVEEEVNYTGLSFGVYQDGSLRYYEFYKDGLEEGIQVGFYPSGELKSYCVIHEGKNMEIFYKWYEDGKIEAHFDGKRWFFLDEEGYMLRRVERK